MAADDLDDDMNDQERKRELRMQRGQAAFDRAGGRAGQHHGLEFAANVINQGFTNHAAAGGKITDTIGKEMDSRVAQLREARRMEHEKEKLRMQMESRNQDREGELIRAILGKKY